MDGLTPSWPDILAMAQAAETVGFDAVWISDHVGFGDPAGDWTGAWEVWTLLSALAASTERVTLGTYVLCTPFRNPALVAKMAETLDEVSGGRLILGLGAGWNDEEHRQLGLPFPEIDERADMLEEHLAVMRGLWGEPDGWSFHGKHVTIEGSQFHPKPVDVAGRPRGTNGAARPRLLVGGGGTKRSARIAAAYADEFNLSSSSPESAVAKFADLDTACVAIGRDPASLTRSTMAGVLIGRDEAEVDRRKTDMLAVFGDDAGGEDWFDAREPRWILGTPDQARSMVDRFAAAGAERIMLQDFLPRDLDMIDLMAEVLF